MPRISQEQKDRNRGKIVTAAGERFRARGIDAVGIDDLMSSAGMTHGGFYNHFASKEDLALEVLHQGFTDSLGEVDRMASENQDSPAAALNAIINSYLTTFHRDHPEAGCASAALVLDAARHGEKAQREYGRGLDGYLSAITDLLLSAAEQSGDALEPEHAREAAIAMFSQMVGALVISRAVAAADPKLSDEVIASTRQALLRRQAD